MTKSLKPEQTYTQRAGCTVNPGNGTWLVKGRDTTHGIDADADGQETGEDTVRLPVRNSRATAKCTSAADYFWRTTP